MLSNNSAETILSGNNGSLSEKLSIITSTIRGNITEYVEICNLLIEQNATLVDENCKYIRDYDKIKEEMNTFKKVSVISNLSKQISAKDNEIQILKKRLQKSHAPIEASSSKLLTSKSGDGEFNDAESDHGGSDHGESDHGVSDHGVSDHGESGDDELDDEVEFELKIIKKQKYYVSNESPPEVFNVSGEDDIGNRVGILINGRIQS